ncbi:Uncharacterised protein [Chlamydia trachomatis]|uniref:Uncharacterized protein n=2 Tax=Gleimia TaxID=2692113 RepID=A0A9W5VWD6_9ACTO|nr:hypothetical protein HMPREF9238_00601 [Gleimia europaea ACS-120-V-Col10b]CRI74734.1 Uncharacterised protein [Chlamydia trachomatis]
MDFSIDEIGGYVLTPQENEKYSDQDLKQKLADLGIPGAWRNIIPRLRGEVSWDYNEFYE